MIRSNELAFELAVCCLDRGSFPVSVIDALAKAIHDFAEAEADKIMRELNEDRKRGEIGH